MFSYAKKESLYISGLAGAGIVFLWLAVFWADRAHAASNTPPPAALAAGYRLNTFTSTFSSSTVDLAGTNAPGYHWYQWNFFGNPLVLNKETLNQDGSITLAGSQIVTAAPAKNDSKFVGTAFGGGAYIEAELKFNPVNVPRGQVWPAFWAMAIEHLAGTTGENWGGAAANTKHFIEVDFFEYDITPDLLGNKYFGVNMHDWYGIYKTTCPANSFCDTHLAYAQVKQPYPAGFDFTQYHKYGFLWIPATANKKGVGQYFLDGKKIGEDVNWEQFTAQAGDPDGQPWKFGVIDQQHLAIILDAGATPPLTVGVVNVWQASASQNLHL